MHAQPRRSRTIRQPLSALLTLSLALGGCTPTPATRPSPKGQPTEVERAVAAAERAEPGGPRREWPRTTREDVVDELHGQRVADPYRWLEQMSRDTKLWLRAQDQFARGKLEQLPARQALGERLKALSYVEWTSAPLRRGKRYFFSRQHADKEKRVHYFSEGPTGEPQVLLDPNAMSTAEKNVSIRSVFPTYDGKRVAYKVNLNAADEATLYVMDVATRKLSARDVIAGAKYAEPSWTPRGDGFYYTRLPVDDSIPVAERPGYAAVYFHRLGDDPQQDRLVREKTGDPRTFIHADLSRDGRFLFLYVFHGWTKTDVYFKDLRRGDKEFRPFAVGLPAKFGIYAWKGKIYVHTNHEAPRWQLFVVDPRRVAREQWKVLVPEDAEAVLDDFAIRGGHLALSYLSRASTKLKIARLDGKLLREVEFPAIGTASTLVGNPEDDAAYYEFSSFIYPKAVYRTSVRRGGTTVHFAAKVPIDPAPFAVEQVTYASKDKTEISMFIIRRKDMPQDGSTPFLLTGYGGFNISITPMFRADFFTWLEQGAGIAIPNLRGGGEYGEKWHQAGMLTRKQNVFDDFIAAAEHLIAKGYTKSDRLAIRGGSNGGLLVGAAMVQRPDLFRAVACHVPLLDMVRYHLFGSGKTWISEYGSADDAAQFRALFAYSPYHHVQPGTRYPALLMFSADNDDRVDPMHARKFVAAVQHATGGEHPVWLRVETQAGHGGGDMIKKQVEAWTDELAFLLRETRQPAPAPAR